MGSILILFPFIGLCFTVISMIQLFEEITINRTGDARFLSEGVSNSLIYTEIAARPALLGLFFLVLGHWLIFKDQPVDDQKDSPKSYLVCLLLSIFLGFLGAHRFYTGKPLLGILYLLTLGGFLIGKYLDILLLTWGRFKDSNDLRVRCKPAS